MKPAWWRKKHYEYQHAEEVAGPASTRTSVKLTPDQLAWLNTLGPNRSLAVRRCIDLVRNDHSRAIEILRQS
jgi:hypothetical protein